MRTTLLLLALLGLTIYLGQPVFSQGESPEAATPAARSQPETPAQPPAEIAVQKPAPRPRKDQGADRLQLPDGSTLPVLNGALGAPPLHWTGPEPFSPIERVVTDPGGRQWYVHRDGTYTITQMVFDSRLGTTQAATSVYRPKRALPLSSSR